MRRKDDERIQTAHGLISDFVFQRFPLFILSKQGTPVSFMTTTRSRTGLFLSYRDSKTPRRRSRLSNPYTVAPYNDDEENEHLIQNNHVAIDIPLLPPKWSFSSSLHIFPTYLLPRVIGSTFPIRSRKYLPPPRQRVRRFLSLIALTSRFT